MGQVNYVNEEVFPDFIRIKNRQPAETALPNPASESAPSQAEQPTARSARRHRTRVAQRELDVERGYSINTKQVVLAFAVEFFIIGLILVAQYLIAESVAEKSVFAILLFPIGLAVVELARVPLAIAVRTQNSWSVKIFASFGVLAAVIVTSFSLSTIAYQTFDPRLSEANEKMDRVSNLIAEREILKNEIVVADADVKAKKDARNSINERYSDLQSQISKISTTQGNVCSTNTNPDGTQTRRCSPTNVINAAQQKTRTAELANVKKEMEAAVRIIRPAKQEVAPALPDEALAYILGPIIKTFQDEVKAVVASSMNQMKPPPAPPPKTETT